MKKMKLTLLTIALAFLAQATFGQVLITDGTTSTTDPNPNAVLDLKSNQRPLILPWLLNSNLPDATTFGSSGMIFMGAGAINGYYYNIRFITEDQSGNSVWATALSSLNGLNALADVRQESPLYVSSYYIGEGAGPDTDNAINNLVIGFEAGKNMAKSGGDMKNNTVIGSKSASDLTSGSYNTFVGNNSGPSNGNGTIEYSTLIGTNALASGNNSTALGAYAEADGPESIAIGHDATSIIEAISIGSEAKALGLSAVALGHLTNSFSEGSIAIGYNAEITYGSDNAVAIGSNSRADKVNATALGVSAKAIHTNSTAIGYNAETSSDNQIMLGANEFIFMPGIISNGSDAVSGNLAVYIDQTSGELKKGPALPAPNKGFEESEIIISLQKENEELRQRLEKLEAIVEELVQQ